MKKHLKVFFLLVIMIFILMVASSYNEYRNMTQIKHLVALEESSALSKFIKSFRKVYLKAFIEHGIEINDKTLNLLPVKTLPNIAKEFESLLGGNVSIRTVSERPRNPTNKSNPFENEIIKYFNDNKNEDSYVSHENDSSHSYFVPLYIEQRCLNCHGKKEEALEAIRLRYDKAYDYKLGDLRGLIHLKISDTKAFSKLDDAFYSTLLAKSLIFIFMCILLYYLINKIEKNEMVYTKKLEKRVKEQVYEIRKKDEILNTQSKMASMGEMLENIAHQWRQPLSAISTASSGTSLCIEVGEMDKKQVCESLNHITESAQYLSSTIDDFRDFFKSNKSKDFFNIKDCYEKTLIIVDSKFRNKEIEIISDINDVNVFGVDNELVQVLINILNNAKDALLESENERNLIFVDIKKVDNKAIMLIRDNANGIPKDIIAKIFDPYYTTKHQSQGTGLGLYMSQEIISKHFNGSLSVKNCEYNFEGKNYLGAQFEIILSCEKES